MSDLPRKASLKDGTIITIREAIPEDAEAIIEMVISILKTSSYTLTTPEEFRYTPAEEADLLSSYLEKPGSLYLIAEQNGKLLGNISFSNGKKNRNQHQGEFAMGIIETYRSKGIGTILLETFLDWAEKNPLIHKVKLGVFIQNSHAINLYKNFGFIEEGRLVKEIKMEDNDFMDLILMYKLV